jgi:RimJ/RimL family protein N-acetyltransferase
MSFSYEGKLTRLVPTNPDKHAANANRWINSWEIGRTLGIGHMPHTMADTLSWFATHSEKGTNAVFAIELLDGTHIGISGVHNIDHRLGRANTGSYIGDPENWGKGYGKDAALIRARYCFLVLGLRQITTEYLEGNERSKRMSEYLGFEQYGFLPEAFYKDGKWLGDVKLRLTRERFFELHPEAETETS